MQKSNADVSAFIKYSQGKALIAGYGSLLSPFSRKTYSQIESTGLAVTVAGWERNWLTRSIDEQQTYASAIPNANKKLSAQLIAINFDEKFANRERDYRFTKINADALHFADGKSTIDDTLAMHLAKLPIYICETLLTEPSTPEFPVNYSYINTCLSGSYEEAGVEGIERFFEYTEGWSSTDFHDDSAKPLYPRHTPMNTSQWNTAAYINKAKR